jgi:flagellar biosynthesis GTPase FlhF
MKVELVRSNTLTNGIKEISSQFGPTALILRNIEADGEEFLFIAHENSAKQTIATTETKQTDLERKLHSINPPQASKEDIESVKQALKALPNSLNFSNPKKEFQTDINSKLPSNNNRTGTSERFHTFLDNAPISQHVAGLLRSFIHQPDGMDELFAQLQTGIMENLPEPCDINFNSKIHILTGGHGAGKTSVALKMASQLSKVSDHKVCVVSFGNNKSGDLAKLKTVGKSLDVPVFCARDRSELAKLLYIKQPEDIYVIDLELSFAAEIVPLARDINANSQAHLVIPTDTSFESFWATCMLDKWDSIILTRLDLPLAPWVALEALSKFQIPLSIGSANKNIESNLVRVSKDNIVNRLRDHIRKHLTSDIKTLSDREPPKVNALH